MCSKNIDKVTKIKESGAFKTLTPQDLGLATREVRISPESFAVWIRVLLQNGRQGTVGCKGRADVAYSNKKPWKQKGTGRARAGSRRSPLWRGGGVIFGPQPRIRTLKVNKILRKRVLGDMFWDLLNDKKVLCLNWEISNKPKTADAFNNLKSMDLHNKKVTLFVEARDILTQASFANLPNVQILLFDEVNAFHLASGTSVVFLQKDLDVFKNMVVQCA